MRWKIGKEPGFKNNILNTCITNMEIREEKNPLSKTRRLKIRRKHKELTSYIFLKLLLQTLVWDFQDLEPDNLT